MNKQVSIFCQESLHQWLLDSNLFFTHNDGELEVIVKNDWDNLTVKNFIESIGIDSNNVSTVKLTNMI